MKNLVYVLMVMALCGVGFANLTVFNHSFEDPILADGGYGGGGSILYWSSNNFIQVHNPLSAAALQPSDGDNYAYLFTGSMWQAAWFIEANTVYTVTVDLAASSGLDPQLAWSQIGFFANSHANLLTSVIFNNAVVSGVIPTDTFGTFTLTWDSTGSAFSGGVNILLLNFTSDRVYYDNVRMAAIPEPTTLAILGLGGLGLLRRRK